MASRQINVEILGDSTSLEKAFARSARSAQQFKNAVTSSTSGNALKQQVADTQALVAQEEKLVKVRSRRAYSLGPFRLAGVGLGAGLGLFAATQAVRELGDRLVVTGQAAFTAEGKLRNMASALTSGNLIRAFEALRAAPKTLEDLGSSAGIGADRMRALRQVAAGATDGLHDVEKAAGMSREEIERMNDIFQRAGTSSADLARSFVGQQDVLRSLEDAQRDYNLALIDGIKVMVDYKGAHDANIGGVERDRAARKGLPSIGPLSASQRRELELIGQQGTARLPGLQDRLKQLNNQLEARGFNDKQRLQILTNIKQTEAEIASIYADQAAEAKSAAAAAKRAAEARAAAAKAAREQRLATQLGWLEFAAERADVTKPINDNLKALRAIEDYWQERVQSEGRKLELVRALWQTQQRIRDLTKKESDVDPLAGLRQASTRQLVAQFGAGLGLGGAGRRRLGFNISGAQIQPIYNSIQVDGREIARAATTGQTRSGQRTAAQTSGRRG